MADVGLVRKRIRAEIDKARRDQADRRVRVAEATEMELDATADPPQPLVTTTRTRGSRVIQDDRTIKGSNPLVQLTEEDVIEMLLEELRPWLR
jgi:hypothetical protein